MLLGWGVECSNSENPDSPLIYKVQSLQDSHDYKHSEAEIVYFLPSAFSVMPDDSAVYVIDSFCDALLGFSYADITGQIFRQPPDKHPTRPLFCTSVKWQGIGAPGLITTTDNNRTCSIKYTEGCMVTATYTGLDYLVPLPSQGVVDFAHPWQQDTHMKYYVTRKPHFNSQLLNFDIAGMKFVAGGNALKFNMPKPVPTIDVEYIYRQFPGKDDGSIPRMRDVLKQMGRVNLAPFDSYINNFNPATVVFTSYEPERVFQTNIDGNAESDFIWDLHLRYQIRDFGVSVNPVHLGERMGWNWVFNYAGGALGPQFDIPTSDGTMSGQRIYDIPATPGGAFDIMNGNQLDD